MLDICRNDGQKLWDIKDIAGARISIFLLSLVSFLFLYPSSFNLLEVCYPSQLISIEFAHRFYSLRLQLSKNLTYIFGRQE
jgi:hypothetical protein